MSSIRGLVLLVSICFVIALYIGFIEHRELAAFVAGACLVALLQVIYAEYKQLKGELDDDFTK